MKLLIVIDSLHHKNRHGLQLIINHLGLEHRWISIHELHNNMDIILAYDVIYSSTYPLPSSRYPNQKFIFGPHFSLVPNKQQIDEIHSSNMVYIQPSPPAAEIWKTLCAPDNLPIAAFPFAVDITRFKPAKTKVFLYYKRRHPSEYTILTKFLDNQTQLDNFEYRVFDYVQRYSEDDYLEYLKQCKWGVILDAHESQGFAIQEALSTNVPLLVWNARTMGQEFNGQEYAFTGSHGAMELPSVPYWDSRCGEVFYTADKLEPTYQRFISNLQTGKYNPRQFILDTLSPETCANRFLDLVQSISSGSSSNIYLPIERKK